MWAGFLDKGNTAETLFKLYPSLPYTHYTVYILVYSKPGYSSLFVLLESVGAIISKINSFICKANIL